MGIAEYQQIMEVKGMVMELLRRTERGKAKVKKPPTPAQLEVQRKFTEARKKEAAARRAAKKPELKPPIPNEEEEEGDLLEDLWKETEED